MATTRFPAPLGLGANFPAIGDGTLCRAASFAPGSIGLQVEQPLTCDTAVWLADQEAVETAPQIDVDKYLQALGKPGAPQAVRERVEEAAQYFETHFPTRTVTEIVGFLKGIDFSLDVRVVALASIAPVDSILIQNVASGRPGNFFTKPGYAVDQLGIAQGSREFRRFRVNSGGGMVLVSTAAAVSDTWTPGRTLNVYTPILGRQPWQPPARAGELVGGGGLQIVIPNPLKYHVTPLDRPA